MKQSLIVLLMSLLAVPAAGHGFKPEEQAQNLQQISAFLEALN